MNASIKFWRRLVDFAELELNGWSDLVVCGVGGTDRVIVSLPLRVEWRTKGSRVMVIRMEE